MAPVTAEEASTNRTLATGAPADEATAAKLAAEDPTNKGRNPRATMRPSARFSAASNRRFASEYASSPAAWLDADASATARTDANIDSADLAADCR